MAKFKTIITTVGAAKIAAVLAGTGSIVLDNTAKMAVGDGSGTLPTPNPAQTKLVNEVHRASINKASIDASDPKNIIAELVIPPKTGGFWLREMALYDAAGTLLAVGNMAETYKPSLSEGAGRKMVIRMVIAVSEVSAITITMDTSTVMATQDYVDTEIDKHAKSRNHPDATLTAKGFTQLNSATDSASETQAATPKAVKTVMDATSLKAPLASPALSGVPTAPTAPPGTNTQQLANTQFVLTAIASLINSAPGVLDTLGELAAALGNDANFAATMTAALAAKAPLASPALSGLPTAPTAAPGTSTLQLANTEFVQAAVTRLINSSPAALDTLKELADALGNDANFATTMTNALAGKQPKDTTLTNISGKDVAGLLQYLGLNRIIQIPEETRVVSPGGERYLMVKDDGFGLWDKSAGPIPLEVVYGGTGAKDAVGALNNFGIGPIASASEVTAGTAKKLVDAERLIGAIATDADIQNRVARKLVDAVALMNAIATRDEIDSGEPRKLVSAAGLINSIATDADIQNKVPRKLVDSFGLINAITTMQDVQDGALRKFVNALTLKSYLPAKALSGNGFIRIPDVPGGTIIQYGQVSGSIREGGQGVVYPTPFPNATRFAIAIPLNLSGNNGCDLFAQLNGVSTTGCNFYFSWATSSMPADGFQWFALGY